jgi:hypothetical protein
MKILAAVALAVLVCTPPPMRSALARVSGSSVGGGPIGSVSNNTARDASLGAGFGGQDTSTDSREAPGQAFPGSPTPNSRRTRPAPSPRPRNASSARTLPPSGCDSTVARSGSRSTARGTASSPSDTASHGCAWKAGRPFPTSPSSKDGSAAGQRRDGLWTCRRPPRATFSSRTTRPGQSTASSTTGVEARPGVYPRACRR